MKNNGFSIIKMLFLIGILLIVVLFSLNFYNRLKSDKNEEGKNKNNSSEDNNQIENTFDKLYFTLENSLLQSAQNYVILYDNSSLEMIIPYSKLKEKNLISNLVDPRDSSNLCNGYVSYNGKGEYKVYLSCPGSYETENYNKDFQ